MTTNKTPLERLRRALQSIAVEAVRAQDETEEVLEETLDNIERDLRMAREASAELGGGS